MKSKKKDEKIFRSGRSCSIIIDEHLEFLEFKTGIIKTGFALVDLIKISEYLNNVLKKPKSAEKFNETITLVEFDKRVMHCNWQIDSDGELNFWISINGFDLVFKPEGFEKMCSCISEAADYFRNTKLRKKLEKIHNLIKNKKK